MKRINFTDPQAREAIFKELETNLFVEASAGSGKTTSLVNRMVALVEHDVPVDKICTITFTIAAADEFFSRFQELLSRRSIDNPNDESIKDLGPITEDSRKKCLNALNNIDQCFNGTMDSFCNMVAHELPNELGLPSDAQVVSDDFKKSFIKEKYFEVLTNPEHPLYSLAGKFNHAFTSPFNAFYAGIESINDYRDYKIAFEKTYLDSSTDNILDEDLDKLDKVANAVIDEAFAKLGKGARSDLLPLKYLRGKNIKMWKDNVEAINGACKAIIGGAAFAIKKFQGTDLEKNYLIERTSASYGFNDDTIDLAKRISETCNEYLFELMLTFVIKMRDEILEDMKKKGYFSFFDFLYYLNKKFQESCNGDRQLIEHVFERHSHILIDESQDTNPIQTELFFYLTSTVKTDDWRKAKPHEGSLFIVGDPKQSIYGFRDADVNAFNETKGLFEQEDELIFLTKNYRSNVVLKEWFNKVMNDVLKNGSTPLPHPNIPIELNTPQELERHQFENDPNITFNGVYYYETGRDKKEDAPIVAQLIDTIVNNDNYKIVAKKVPDKNEPARKIEYKDILVITNSTYVQAYVDAFAENHIPFIVEARIFFEKSPSLLLLIKLIYLMFEPYKTQHLVHVLEDLYNFDSKDLCRIKMDGFDFNIANLNDKDGNHITFTEPKHRDALLALNELFMATRGMTVSSTAFYLLTNMKYRFLNKIDNTFLEYAYFLIELLKQYEVDGTINSFADADEFLQDVVGGHSDIPRAMRFKQNVNQVKISNLHKVKGLQAPVVILAEPLAKSGRVPFKYVDRNNKTIYFSRIFEKRDNGSENVFCSSNNYGTQMDLAVSDSKSERGRLEYVAATRAEAVLLISRPQPKKAKGKQDEEDKSEKYWIDLTQDPETKDYDVFPNADKVVDEKPVNEILDDSFTSDVKESSNDASYEIKNPSLARRTRPVNNNVDRVVEADEDHSNKTLIGTLVHRLLECIVKSKNKYSFDDLMKKINDEYRPSEDYSPLLKSVYEHFTNGGYPQSTDDAPQDLLKVLLNAEDVMCELPFAYKTDNGKDIVSGTIDLLYKDDKGWHIVDYKTNLEDNIKKLEEEYEIQLNTYAKAFKNFSNGEPLVDVHIYHINV